MRRPRLAGLATIPGRPLERALRSLRPQVDELCVYLNGFTEVPSIVKTLDCHAILDPENRGAERKLAWTRTWTGLYYSMDDDIDYLPGYADFLEETVDRWRGMALVSLHGRRFTGAWPGWTSPVGQARYYEATLGGWCNHLGTGVLAFDTGHLRPPHDWPKTNSIDALLSVWAQRQHLPMWIPAHDGSLAKPIQGCGEDSIYETARKQGYANRNRIYETVPFWQTWSMHGVHRTLQPLPRHQCRKMATWPPGTRLVRRPDGTTLSVDDPDVV